MRVLLLSEGSHEGHPAEDNPQALQALVRRVLPKSAEYLWRAIRDVPRGNPFPGKSRVYFNLALRAIQYAGHNKFDALVCVTDADRCHERITEFNAAQEETRLLCPRALGIAIEAFDAWILADHQALGRALGVKLPLLPSPEGYDGGKNSDRHPKQVCRQLMRQHKWDGPQAEFYEAVCRDADLEVIADRCPKGFRPFLQRLRALAARLV